MATLLTETRPAEPVEKVSRPEPVSVKPARLVSLDAYRGFIMLAMASAGFAFSEVARKMAREGTITPLWQFLGFQTDHVQWVGCSFWDLIQPSFMFMVGVAIPYSYASRKAKGDSEGKILGHAAWRAVLLVLLAVFLSSSAYVTVNGHREEVRATNWIFPNVLAQIGLGYFFVFLLRGRGLPVQLGAVVLIFAGYTLFFGLWPLPAPGFDTQSVGVKPDWMEQYGLTGWFAHWNKNTNAAAAFDVWFLNLFPRKVPFHFNEGGYQTLNFVPSMITMILGLMAGEMLRGPRKPWAKLAILVASGAACLGLGLLAGEYVCPIVKRIWTPSWALYSAGWTFFILAGFYAVIDLLGFRRWAWAFVVVGMNSIAMYCMAQLLKPWVAERWKMHLDPWWYKETQGPLAEVVQALRFEGPYGVAYKAAAILLVLWLVCVWMYRRKIFIRI